MEEVDKKVPYLWHNGNMRKEKESLPEAREEGMKALHELIEAAVREDWVVVDRRIKEALTPAGMKWAVEEGIVHENPHVRDLAATMFQKSDMPLGDSLKDTLLRRMKEDESVYVQYRLAMALWKHKVRPPLVESLMREAMEDDEIAREARVVYESR